ncbi:MAG: hypothetical protein Q7U23_01255, partial [Methylococcales bacterium]|nr:hypothetical protein [Methylococcales bacterium]
MAQLISRQLNSFTLVRYAHAYHCLLRRRFLIFLTGVSGVGTTTGAGTTGAGTTGVGAGTTGVGAGTTGVGAGTTGVGAGTTGVGAG